MTPERMAGLVARWARLYTRNLPTPIASRRVEEIDADLHDHIDFERTIGTSDGRIALSILSRMVRGLAADASWRGHHATPITTTDNAMRNHSSTFRSTRGVVLAAALILLLPAFGMLVSDEVAWGPADFAIAGALLVGAGLVREVAARRAGDTAYRVAIAVALGAALFLLWSVLAVGVVGETGDAADLLYGGVLAIGILGAVVTRFRPQGMARALLAMALAQALVAVVALLAGKHEAPVSSVSEIVGVNALFVALFLGSALLFRHSARA